MLIWHSLVVLILNSFWSFWLILKLLFDIFELFLESNTLLIRLLCGMHILLNRDDLSLRSSLIEFICFAIPIIMGNFRCMLLSNRYLFRRFVKVGILAFVFLNCIKNHWLLHSRFSQNRSRLTLSSLVFLIVASLLISFLS